MKKITKSDITPDVIKNNKKILAGFKEFETVLLELDFSPPVDDATYNFGYNPTWGVYTHVAKGLKYGANAPDMHHFWWNMDGVGLNEQEQFHPYPASVLTDWAILEVVGENIVIAHHPTNHDTTGYAYEMPDIDEGFLQGLRQRAKENYDSQQVSESASG